MLLARVSFSRSCREVRGGAEARLSSQSPPVACGSFPRPPKAQTGGLRGEKGNERPGRPPGRTREERVGLPGFGENIQALKDGCVLYPRLLPRSSKRERKGRAGRQARNTGGRRLPRHRLQRGSLKREAREMAALSSLPLGGAGQKSRKAGGGGRNGQEHSQAALQRKKAASPARKRLPLLPCCC